MAKQPEVNKRNVQLLLRELSADRQGPIWEEYQKADRQVDELTAKLLDNDDLKAAMKVKDAAYDRWHFSKEEFRRKVDKVRRRFLAHGPTESVMKALDALIDEVNGQ